MGFLSNLFGGNKEDKALRDRTRNDTYLRRATDVLLGLKALGYGVQR